MGGEERAGLLKRPVILLIAVVLVGSTLSLGIWFILITIHGSGPIPNKFRQGLSYPLYYPTNLPTGYRVDDSSFKRQGDVLVFSILAPNGRNIAVSEESIPPNLNLTHQVNSADIALPDQSNFTTAAGSAQISLWGDKLVSSLVTNHTWIVLNITGFKMNDAQKVTQAFTRLN